MNNKRTGDLGENIAKRYLFENGYKILDQKHKEGFDEIDIVGLGRNRILIFFEIKTILSDSANLSGFMPEDNFTRLKFKKIARASQKFIIKNPTLMNEDVGWRIDLIAIRIGHNKKYDLRHYKNV